MCWGVSSWVVWNDIPWGHRREPCENLVEPRIGGSHAGKDARICMAGGCGLVGSGGGEVMRENKLDGGGREPCRRITWW